LPDLDLQDMIIVCFVQFYNTGHLEKKIQGHTTKFDYLCRTMIQSYHD